MLVDVENLIQLDLIDPLYFINLVLGMTHQGALLAIGRVLMAVPKILITNTGLCKDFTKHEQLRKAYLGW